MTVAAASATPQEKLEKAWEYYRLSEFNVAIREFQALQQSSEPGSEYALQALYGEGACWNFRRDARNPVKALAVYRTIIDAAPVHPLAAWSALDSVRATYLGKGEVNAPREEEIAAYREVWRKYPDTTAGHEGFLFHAALRSYWLLQTGDQTEAEALLREAAEFLQAHPRTSYLSQTYSIMSTCCKVLGRQRERLAYSLRSVETREFDQKNPNANKSAVYWSVAYTAEFEVGDFAVAREYYQRVIQEYPQDLRVFPAREALARMDAVEAAVRSGQPLPQHLIPGARP